MKSPRNVVALLGCAAIFALGSGWAWHALGVAHAWRDARPALPETKGFPDAFGVALRDADAAVARRDVAALGRLAELYLANGSTTEAERCLRALVRFEPTAPRWSHRLGVLLAASGRLDEAVPFLQQACALAPDSVISRLKLAEALAKTNRAAEAAEWFRAVLKLEPHNAYALVGLARLDVDDGRWSAARLQLEEAERLAPEFSAAPSLLATVYERSGRAEDAARARQRASRLGRYLEPPDPWMDELWRDCFDPYRLRVTAATLALGNEPLKALPVLARAQELAPKDARTLRQLARLHRKLQQFPEASRWYEATLAEEAAEGATYLEAIGVCRALDDASGAARWIQEGLRRFPDEAGLHFEHGRDLAAAGRLEEAEHAFAEAMRLGPEVTSSYVERATVLLRLGRGEVAVEVMEAALARQPDRAQADELLVRARRAGLTRAALERLAASYAKAFGTAPPR